VPLSPEQEALASRLVHLEDGMFGEIAVIQDSQWVRSMRFGVNGPRQSIVDLIEPHTLLLRYAKVCMLGLAALTDCRSVLVVGLGAGSIPMFLRQYFPNAQIDVVEIDTAVVKVAKQFFMFHEDDRLKVFIEDGRTFADSTKKTYDLIIVDAYASDDARTFSDRRCISYFQVLSYDHGGVGS